MIEQKTDQMDSRFRGNDEQRKKQRRWIPASAGMTGKEGQEDEQEGEEGGGEEEEEEEEKEFSE